MEVHNWEFLRYKAGKHDYYLGLSDLVCRKKKSLDGSKEMQKSQFFSGR